MPPSAPSVTVEVLPGNRRPLWVWSIPAGSPSDTTGFRYQLDGEEAEDWLAVGIGLTSYRPETDLSEESHKLHVQACDAAGNWSSSGSATANLDPSVPVVGGTTPTGDTTPTWTIDPGSDAAAVECQLDGIGGSWISVAPDAGSYTPEDALSDGSHTLYVRARSSAGTWSEPGSFGIVVDTQPPSAPTVTGTSPTVEKRPTWNWNVPFDAASGVAFFRYRLNGDGGTWTETGVEITVYALGFDLEEPRTLIVQAGDAVGNWSASGSLTIEPVWRLETVDSRSSSVGHGIALDHSKTGLPGICYVDSASASLIYALRDGTTWQLQTLDEGDAGNVLSSIVSDNNRCDVAYMDPTGKILRAIYFDPYYLQVREMRLEGTDASPLLTGISVRMDNSWRPIVASAREGTEIGFRYLLGTIGMPGYWTAVYFPGDIVGWAPSMAKLSNGGMQVAWLRSDGVFMSSWESRTWQNDGIAVAAPSLDSGCKTSIIVDSDDLAGIAYSTTAGEIWFAKENGTGFDIRLAREASSEPLGVFCLDYDSHDDRPVLVYIEGSNLWCAVLNGTAWEREQVASGVAEAASVAVDENGRIMIAYHDGVNGHLRFASRVLY